MANLITLAMFVGMDTMCCLAAMSAVDSSADMFVS